MPAGYQNGTNIVVSSGAMLNAATVASGSTVVVLAGGEELFVTDAAFGPTVVSGGYVAVSSGGVASDITGSDAATVIIYSGGAASNVTLSGGDLGIESGGAEFSATLTSNAYNWIDSGGSAVDVTMQGGEQSVSSASVTGTTLTSGAQQYLGEGASATATTIADSATQQVEYRGSAFLTAIEGGGTQNVEYLGTASGVTINSGGTQNVYYSGSASSVTIANGGTQDVYNSGSTCFVTVDSGGQELLNGGQVSGATVYAGGQQIVEYGGTASATTLSGGTQFVSYGGAAVSTTIASGGIIFIEGGSVSETTIDSGGLLIVVSGSATGTTVLAGGTLADSGAVLVGTVNSFWAGSASAVMVSGGATLYVIGGGATVSVDVASGGVEQVISGTTTGTVVGSGGGESVAYGGVASVTNVSGGTLLVSGGQTYGTTVNGGDEELLGGLASGTTVSAGGLGVAYGVTSGTLLYDGGAEVVSGGGSAIGTTVSSGGIEFLAGGVDSGATVDSGGMLFVLPGGDAVDTTLAGGTVVSTGVALVTQTSGTVFGAAASAISAGAETTLYVLSGGSVFDTTLDQGNMLVASGGAAVGVNVVGGTLQVNGGMLDSAAIGSGGSLAFGGGSIAGVTVGQGGVVDVSTGTVSGLFIGSGGSLYTDFGVTVSGATVYGFHSLYSATAISETVGAGGVISGVFAYTSATTLDGGTEVAYAGSTAGTTVNSDGRQIIEWGGSALNTAVNSGGQQIIEWAGSALNATVNSGGQQVIEAEGIASGTAVNGGGTILVDRGGDAEGTVVASGGTEAVMSGGILDDVTIQAGATLELSGVTLYPGQSLIVTGLTAPVSGLTYYGYGALSGVGLTVGATVYDDSTETISAGGVASGTVVLGTGLEQVGAGGVASGTELRQGGSELLTSGGASFATIVSSGGLLAVSSGAVASASVLESAGSISVASGGTTYGTMVDSGAVETLATGATASATQVENGGSEVLVSGGTAFATIVSGGGVQTVSTGGVANGTVVALGGSEVISGGVASATQVQGGGSEAVTSGGIAFGTVASSGGTQIVSAGGLASLTTLDAGGIQLISVGGSSLATTVGSGGIEIVMAGGSAIDTTVDSGGVLLMLSGGGSFATTSASGGAVVSTGDVIVGPAGAAFLSSPATGVTVGSATTLYVLSDGVVSGASVFGGGLLDIVGGSAVSSFVGSGGNQIVTSGGTVFATSVGAGGIEQVQAGVASATLIGSGGAQTLANGGVASGAEVQSGGSERVASGGTTVATVIDSGGIEFVTAGGSANSTTVSSGGVLFVMAGGSATETVLAGGDVVSSGLLLVTPTGDIVLPASATAVSVSSGDTLYVLAGGTATSTMINAGGSEIVFGGIASNDIVAAGGVVSVLSGGIADGEDVSSGGTLLLLPGGVASGTMLASGGSVVFSGGVASGTILYGNGNPYQTQAFDLIPGGDTVELGNSYGVVYYNQGDGAATIELGTGYAAIYLGAGITGNELTYSGDAAGTLTIDIGSSGDAVYVPDDLFSYYSQINNLYLTDGSVIYLNDVPFTYTGTTTNKTLTGSANHTDNFILGPGGDTVIDGDEQNDIYYNVGDGAATIEPYSYDGGTIYLGSGITANELTFQADGAGDVMIDIGSTADSILVQGDLYSGWWGNYSKLSPLVLSDGTTIDLTQVPFTYEANANNTTLIGSGWNTNIFDLAPGGDTVELGSSHDQVYYSSGDGAATIEPNGGSGTLYLGAGITESDLTFLANSAGDVTIEIGNAGDSVLIEGDLYQSWGLNSRFGPVVLADGTAINLTQVAFTLDATPGAPSTLNGTGWNTNVFNLAPGGDTVVLGTSHDQINYAIGDGAATIDLNGGSGSIFLGSGITASDLTFQSDSAGDVTIDVGSTGDSILVEGDLYNSWGIQSRLNPLVLSDGSTISLTSLTDTYTGTAIDTTLVGSGWGSNVFYLAPGGDTVVFGNGNEGGSNQNTLYFDKGDGAATIATNGGYGTVILGADVASSDVSVTVDLHDTVTLTVLDTGDTLTFTHGFLGLEAIDFADGTVLTQSDLAQQTVNYLFEDALTRTADLNGLAGYSQQMLNGTTPQQILVELATSGEEQSDLSQAYYDATGQNISSAELNALETAIIAGSTQVQVEAAIAAVTTTTTVAGGSTLTIPPGNVLLGTFDLANGAVLSVDNVEFSGGVISGGTIETTSGALIGIYGTLSGVAFAGSLDLSQSNSTLTIMDGTTFSAADGSGRAQINFTGSPNQQSYLNVIAGSTLDNASIDLGTNNFLVNLDPTNSGAALTLGPDLSIVQTGTNAMLGEGASDPSASSGTADGGGIVNQGTIIAGISGEPGAILYIDANGFINDGTIDVIDGGYIDLLGTISAALVSSINPSSGGETLIGGTVDGGTIVAPSGGIGAANGVLCGVTYEGTLDLSRPASLLTLTDDTVFSGANGVGAATINFNDSSGSDSFLNVTAADTLDNATIDIGCDGGANFIVNLDTSGSGAVLTLGAGLSIVQTNSDAVLADATSDSAVSQGIWSGGGIINDGTIMAGVSNVSGAVFTIDATGFVNNGAINVGDGGYIYLLGITSAALVDSINPSSGGEVLLGGTVSGGTITSPYGAIGSLGGWLNGVAFDGTLDLSRPNSLLTVTDGTTFAGANGAGAAIIDFNDSVGQYSYFNVQGNETLDYATIEIGSSGGNNYLVNLDTADIGAVLTLGRSLSIVQAGNNSVLAGGTSDSAVQNGGFSGGGIVNDGTITAGVDRTVFYVLDTQFTNNGTIFADGAASEFIVAGTGFTNAGSIAIGNGENFNASGDSLQNTGLVTVTGGATLSLGSFTNDGTITVVDGTLVLNTPVAALELGAITVASGGKVVLAGSWTADQINALGTISQAGGVVQIQGTVAGGTIDTPTGGLGSAGGTLAEATVQGTLNLAAAGSFLTIAGDLAMAGAGGNGAGVIRLTGNSSTLLFTSTTTLDHATFNIGSYGWDYLSLANAAQTLTLGASLNVQQVGSLAEFAGNGGSLTNDGTLTAGFRGGYFLVSAGTLTNNGTLGVDNGAKLDLGLVGDVSNLSNGVLTGGSFFVGEGSTLEFAGNAPIITDLAAITLSSDGSVIYDTSGNSIDNTLGAIGAGGTLALLDGRNFTARSGSDFIDAGVVTLGSATFGVVGGRFDLADGTIDGTGTVQANVVLSGSLDQIAGGSIVLAAGLSGDGALSIDLAAGVVLYGGASTGGLITDSGVLTLLGGTLGVGTLAIGAVGTLTGFGTVTGGIDNAGLIEAHGGTLAVAGIAGLDGGVWSGIGLQADAGATLVLTGESAITGDAGGITLAGSAAQLESFDPGSGSDLSLAATLATITASGTLSLLGGAGFAAAGTLDDAGTVILAGGTFSAATLLLEDGATLVGSGTLDGPVTLAGNVTASGGTLEIDGTVSGSGTLSIAAGEVLVFGPDAVFAASQLVPGTVQLAGGSVSGALLAPGSTGRIAGYGTIEGPLTPTALADAIGGTLFAAGVGSVNDGTLTAGQLEADSGAVLELAPDTAIAVIAGSMTLSGAGSVIESLDSASGTEVSVDDTLVQVAVGGTLALLDGRAFTVTANAGGFEVDGTLLVDGGTFDATLLTVTATGTVAIGDTTTLTLPEIVLAGGLFAGAGTLEVLDGATLSGFGTIASGIDINGVVTADGGTLTITGPITSAGTLAINQGAALDLADGGVFFGSVSGAGSLINNDLLDGFVQGVSLAGSGLIGVINTASGEIDAGGDNALTVSADAAMVDNDGAINGAIAGLVLTGGDATLTNSGLITGDQGAAVAVGGTGTATITNTGLIVSYESPGPALDLSGIASAVVTNAGTIEGNAWQTEATNQTAIQFGSGDNLLVVDPGAVFLGNVFGGAGTNTLELAAGGGQPGSLDGLGSSFVGFGSVIVDSGATWALGDATGDGTITLDAGAVLTASGALGETGGVLFLGGDTLNLASLADLTAPLANFDSTDTIDLTGIAATGASLAGDTLTLTGAGGALGSLTFLGDFTGHSFVIASDGHGGSTLVLH